MIEGLLIAALVAGLTALDSVHICQWLFSRPIVIGSLVGWILGEPASGMLCGASIELLWLSVLPIANYIPPDAHVAAACSSAAAALWQSGGGTSPAAPACLAVLLCVPAGIVSKMGDFRLRRSLAVRAEAIMAAEPPYHIAGLAASVCLFTFLKAAAAVLLVGVIAVVVKPLVACALARPHAARGLCFAFSLFPGLGMVQLARCLGARGRERYVALGALAALLALISLALQS